MKLIMTLAMILSATIVNAGSFELVKDGITYSCEEKINSNPGAAVVCAQEAMDPWKLALSKADALAFCQGAQNNGPVVCAQQAMDPWKLALSKSEALTFCKGAQGSAAITCAQEAMDPWKLALPKADALNFCRGAKDNSRVDCALKAMDPWGLALSKAEAIKMCGAGVYSVGGTEFVKKVDFLKSIQAIKNKSNLLKN